jgi:murein DD-endopeptidase MepM/ murein hydrolase activator NlpD
MSFSKLFAVAIGLGGLVIPRFAAANLPKQALIPGGVAIVQLSTESQNSPEVYYMGQRVLVLADPKKRRHWLAVIGIPLNAKIGNNDIQIHSNNRIVNKSFLVRQKKYPVQKLTIADQRKVTPLPEDEQKIAAEYAETIQTYTTWEYKQLASLKLALPVKGRLSSPFGLTRIINNIPKNPHSGLDIAAPLGAKVQAAKDGRVINIGDYFYTGNIVFVDHGQGFITSYCHLDKVTVRIGQQLKTGDIIGMVGKTGRATGPHLHWSVSLNGVRVDPKLFIYG